MTDASVTTALGAVVAPEGIVAGILVDSVGGWLSLPA
jgi:hypothetical protein